MEIAAFDASKDTQTEISDKQLYNSK